MATKVGSDGDVEVGKIECGVEAEEIAKVKSGWRSKDSSGLIK